MPFAEDLFEGFAAAAGSQHGVDVVEKRKQRRQALSDMELQSQTQQILGDVQALNERRAKLDPNSPTYQQDVQTIDQALHDARGVFTDLYHPENNPGALAKLSGFIQAHIGRKKGQAPATPAAAKQSIADRMSGIESTAYAATPEKNKFAALRRQLKEAMPNASEAELDRAVLVNAGSEAKPKATSPSWKMYISPDGKQRDYYDVNDKDSIPQGWMPVSKGAENAPKVGSFGDFMIQAYGPHPTAENYEEGKKLWAQSGAGTTVGEHLVMVPQKDGSIVPITVQTTTTKSFTGAPSPSGQPAIPKTPAEVKSRITPPHAGVVGRGGAVGGRLTTPQVAAQRKYDEATGLVKVAELVAANPHDAINQKRLAVQLERLSAGRFTTQALQYVIRAGWGNTLEQWANNVTTGELPEDIVRQLVDGAHQYQAGALEELKTSGATPPANAEDPEIEEIMRALRQQKQSPPPE
jgi:hypothetical protein